MNPLPEPQKYKLNVKPPNIISLIILSAFASMGAALITPALPSISQYFGISSGHAQLTVTAFLTGYALGQLIYGPLANRFGRKPTFYIGIDIATLGSLFSIMSAPTNSFDLMITGRLFEALGSSVGLVVCFTIINDFYFPEQARKMIGFMSLAFAIVPGVAIAIGGFITQYLQWLFCFYFLFIYGFMLILPAVTLPETITQYDKNALHGKYLLSGYLKMFKNKKLMAYSFIYGLTCASIYIFSAQGPLLGIHRLGYAPAVYGMMGLIPYAGAVVGSMITINFSKKLSANHMILIAMVCEFTASIIMLVCFAIGCFNIFTLIFPMILFMAGHALLVSNAAGQAIMQSDDKANASAVTNFIGVATGVLGTFALSTMHFHSVLLLPILLNVCLVIMIGIYFFEVR
jgi:Bcr/CflA subfamily drug resistance transporter